MTRLVQRCLCVALAALLLLPAPGIVRATQDDGASAGSTSQEKKSKLKQLVLLLLSWTNEEYANAISQAQDQNAPYLASRGAALQNAYSSLAALEYKDAAAGAPEKDDYSKAYEQASRAPNLAVSPETLQETGLALDAVKWLGNAALNYWLTGGPTLVGRGMNTDPETTKLNRTIDELEQQLAGSELDHAQRADAHHRLGLAYEKLAKAAAKPESADALAAKKKARVKELASLLQGVSEDEYQEALNELPSKPSGRPELASRGTLLKSAYSTLAAMEYHDAAKKAPEGGNGAYKSDYTRVSRDASSLGVDPETLQETGWGTKLLGLAALGGIGYLVYENQRKDKKLNEQRDAPPPPAGCPAGSILKDGRCESTEVSCPKGTRQTEGACIADIVCPAKTRLTSEGICLADIACPAGTRMTEDGLCMASLVCPQGTNLENGACVAVLECPAPGRLQEGRCLIEPACPEGAVVKAGQCVLEPGCPQGSAMKDGYCVIEKTETSCPAGSTLKEGLCIVEKTEISCPAGTEKKGDSCVGPMTCSAGTSLSEGRCLGDINCPAGTSLKDGRCLAGISCPANTTLTGGLCSADVSCPEGTEKKDGRCFASVQCPEGTSRQGQRCLPAGWKSGSWMKGNPMKDPRYDYTLTELTDGKVLAVGGWHRGVHATAELFDPSSNQWSHTGNLAVTRYMHSAVRLADGRVLVLGGSYGVSGYAKTTEVYTPASGRWGSATPMPYGRGAHVSVLLGNGKVLVAGGGSDAPVSKSGSIAESSALLLDPKTGLWSGAGAMSVGRMLFTATVLQDGCVLVTGGWQKWGATSALASAEVYDPKYNRWSPAGTLSYGRMGHQATLLSDGRVLVVGGMDKDSLSTAEIYDHRTNSWARTGSMAAARAGHFVLLPLLNPNQVLVAGGGGTPEAEIFNVRAGKWVKAGALSLARNNCMGVRLNDGRVLVAGGSVGGGVGLVDTDVYIPGTMPQRKRIRMQPTAVSRSVGPLTPVARDVGTTSKVTRLYESLDGMEQQLVSADVSPEENADIHHRMGAAYEELAGAVEVPAAAEPAKPEAPPRSPAKKQAAPPPEKAQAVEEPAPAPKKARAPAKKKAAPPPQETVEEAPPRDTQSELNDLESEMRRKVERRRKN
ncbi:MAG TPA: hypothetical protein DCM05_17405 [Elusimicrobia bacterium]|nr:hypothetical protein [Elusimicrobiota bacterium]